MKASIIIFGSSRSNGNTFDATKLIMNKTHDASFIDLANYKISDFDYDHQNKDDDFMQVINQALNHETIILATPIYWYTMSASMKRFVDRLSDLLSIDKDRGRLLRNKNLAIISSYSVYPDGKNGFESIFVNTAKYLGMNYLGCYFYYVGDNEKILAMNTDLADKFTNQLNKNPAITQKEMTGSSL